MAKKITKKEIYNCVKAYFENIENAEFNTEVEITCEDIVAFCEKEIESLERKADKAKEYAAARSKKSDELVEKVLGGVTEELSTVAQIVNRVGDEDLTAAKAIYRLNALAEDGAIVKDSISVKENGRTRKLVAFKLPADEE